MVFTSTIQILMSLTAPVRISTVVVTKSTKPVRVVDDSHVAALQAHNFTEFFACLAGGNQICG